MEFDDAAAIKAALDKRASKQTESLRLFRADVTGVTSGLISLQRGDADTDEDAGYPLIFSGVPPVGAEVVAVMLGGAPVVLGVLGTTLPTYINPGSPLIGQAYCEGSSASAATVTSNASNSVFEAARSFTTTTIPNGTYTFVIDWSIALSDSAAASLDTRVIIGATNGTTRSLSVPTTSPATTVVRHVDTFTGVVVSGGITIATQYKRTSGSGTASARNPAIFVTAIRTGA